MSGKKLYCVQNTKWRIRDYKILQIISFNIFLLVIKALWYIKLSYVIKYICRYICTIIPSCIICCLIFYIASFQKLINLISGFAIYGQNYPFFFYIFFIPLRIWNKQCAFLSLKYPPSINVTVRYFFRRIKLISIILQ